MGLIKKGITRIRKLLKHILYQINKLYKKEQLDTLNYLKC